MILLAVLLYGGGEGCASSEIQYGANSDELNHK